MTDPHSHGNGVDVQTKLGHLRIWGRWGAVLALLAVGLILVAVAIGYGVWTATHDFHAGLAAMSEEHRALIAKLGELVDAQNATAWETAQAKCTLFLPQDGDERDKARRYGDVCKYAADVYEPKPGGPKIIVVPIPQGAASPRSSNTFPTTPGRGAR